jgi:hypothetical protein
MKLAPKEDERKGCLTLDGQEAQKESIVGCGRQFQDGNPKNGICVKSPTKRLCRKKGSFTRRSAKGLVAAFCFGCWGIPMPIILVLALFRHH